MNKIILAVLLVATPLASFAQVTWDPTPGSAITFSGSFVRTATPGSNLFSPATANIYNGTSYQGANFSGTDAGNGLYFIFESASANDSSNFPFLGANVRFAVYNSSLSDVSVTANTYQFHFDLPVTAGGEVTGFNAVTAGAFASSFTFSFDGSGGVDLNQVSSFTIPAMTPSAVFTGDFSATASAIPEPATTTLGFAIATGLVVAWRRRRQTG